MTTPDQLRAAFEAWWRDLDTRTQHSLYISHAEDAFDAGFLAGHAAALEGAQPVADTFPDGWHSAAVKPSAPGWYLRQYSDGIYAHYWTGSIWSSTKDGEAHWRQLADAPYPLWRAIDASPLPQVTPALSDERIEEIIEVSIGMPDDNEDTDRRTLIKFARAVLAAAAPDHSPDAGRASPTCKESLPVDADGVPDTSK